MAKVKILRNYGAVVKGDVIIASPLQLNFLLENGIAELTDCAGNCEECEDCKSTKKKRSKTPISNDSVKAEATVKPKRTVRKTTSKK